MMACGNFQGIAARIQAAPIDHENYDVSFQLPSRNGIPLATVTSVRAKLAACGACHCTLSLCFRHSGLWFGPSPLTCQSQASCTIWVHIRLPVPRPSRLENGLRNSQIRSAVTLTTHRSRSNRSKQQLLARLGVESDMSRFTLNS